ncbi:MAG TPA: hypothetical protein ENI62_11890 [Gammaproteobacteria bacterium]|nr:hypothetical protein [Gammaproteobacteria bacterium]
MKNVTQLLLDQVQAGAILGQDVLDAQDNRLLNVGVELTTNTLALLRKRGIKSVCIVQENQLSPEQQQEQQQAIEQRLVQRFRQVQADPDMQQLQTILKDYYLDESSEI